MTARLGVREITRNFNLLDKYEYVEIEDKKNHTLKGLFVSAELTEEVKHYLDNKISAKKKAKIDSLMPFIGMVKGEFHELSSQDIKALKTEKYNG